MKQIKFNLLIILSLLSVSGLFLSCKNDEVIPETTNKGFLEYQYSYQVMVNGTLTTKQAYKRVNITDAVFKLYELNDLPDTLVAKLSYPDSIAKRFRKVELFLYTQDCNTDSLLKPLSQPLGASVVQLSLVDTLALDANTERVLEYGYLINSFITLKSNKKPICLNFTANMNLVTDTTTNSLKYEYAITGQSAKRVNIFLFANGQYQIMANGISNSKIYNLFYIGNIRKEKIIQNTLP